MKLGSPRSRISAALRWAQFALFAFLPSLFGPDALAQAISSQAAAQIRAIASDKEARTPAQRKIDSRLIYASRIRQGLPAVPGVPSLRTRVEVDLKGATVVDVSARVDDALLEAISRLGGRVLDARPSYRSVRALVPLSALETLAALPQVKFVSTKREAVTNGVVASAKASAPARDDVVRERVGGAIASLPAKKAPALRPATPLRTEGDVTHRADLARATYGTSGAGVKVGVLSDGVDSLATLRTAGRLPAVKVLPGQEGTGDEGTAMLEIVHEIAPLAELYFATAFNGIESFAQNIRDLRAAGCDIIVDDVSYFVESPFQKGQTAAVFAEYNGAVVQQAVSDVTGSGALYFSSMGNSGNKDSGTAGVWEGDFKDGGSATGVLAGAGKLHDFGAGVLFETVTGYSPSVVLHWSDPLGGASDDYDLYLLSPDGTTVYGASTNLQDGTQDPVEGIGGAYVDERLVVAKYAGEGRFLHLNTNRGQLSISTAGVSYGHNAPAAPNAFGVAATPAATAFGPPPNPVGPFPGVFTGTDVVELFSSDGPRRFFFNADGSAITPGNVSSTGGQLVQQPLITGADGTSGVTPGFNPFFGTSAAAPHVAAIAALVKSMKPSLTATEISTILKSTAIDIMAPGVDRDSGHGIADAMAAVAAVGAAPRASLLLRAFKAGEMAGNGNGWIEPGECGGLFVLLTNGSLSVGATAISATLATTTPDVTIDVPTVAWEDIAGGGSGVGAQPFLFRLSRFAPCPLVIHFTLTVAYSGGVSPVVFELELRTGLPPANVATTLGTVQPAPPEGVTATATGDQSLRIFRDGVPSTCALPKPFPGVTGSGTRLYDSYTLSNCTGSPACVNVRVEQGAYLLHSVAYNGSFDPTDIGLNYVADSGSSGPQMSYSFEIPAGGTFVVVVHEVTAGAGAGEPYNLTVDGVCLGCTIYKTEYACCTAALPVVSFPAGTVGSAWAGATLTPTGGTGPYTFTVSGLPEGIAPTGPLTGSSLTLAGTPTKAFSGTIQVTATDATGCTARRAYTMKVACPVPPVPVVVTAPSSLPAGSPNRKASVPSHAGSTYAWTIANGTITAGQGTNAITFTAGSAGSPVALGVTESNADLCPSGEGTASIPVLPIGNGSSLFYSLAPCRIVDTRGPLGPLGGPALEPYSIPGRSFVLTGGACGVPAGASAISANMVVTGPTAPGYLLAVPLDGTATGASSINFSPGQTRANNVFLKLASDGSGAIQLQNWSPATAHFVLDVNGYFQ